MFVTLSGHIKISVFILKYNLRQMVMLFVVTKMACGAQSNKEQIDSIPLEIGESQTSFHNTSPGELLKIPMPRVKRNLRKWDPSISTLKNTSSNCSAIEV